MYNLTTKPSPIITQAIYNNGVVIGKFMPFHLGHEILIKFAKSQVNHLYVLVDNVPNELLSSEQRAKIIQDKFPDVSVGFFDKKMPQEPSETPDFWHIWSNEIVKNVNSLYDKKINQFLTFFDNHFQYDNLVIKNNNGIKIDALIASMDYGFELAKHLNTKFIPVDIDREIINISATEIRNHPELTTHLLSEKAKPFFTTKVAFIGSESTFKSSIAKEIRTLNSQNPIPVIYVPEFAKSHLKFNDGLFNSDDVEHIIYSQNNLMNVACEYSGGYLLCDSDALTTKVYAQQVFKSTFTPFPAYLDDIVKNQYFDITFLFKPDENTPFVDDVHRRVFNINKHDNRLDIFNAMEKELITIGRKYIIIEGTYQQRLQTILNYMS